jgi:hypothetical protein
MTLSGWENIDDWWLYDSMNKINQSKFLGLVFSQILLLSSDNNENGGALASASCRLIRRPRSLDETGTFCVISPRLKRRCSLNIKTF